MKHLQCIEYSESSPSGLVWKIKPSNRVKVGDVCGSKAVRNGKTYYETNIFGVRYYCHRLVWELFNGPIQEGLKVDHINLIEKGGTGDNRIGNLQLLKNSDNVRKSNTSKNNTSGVKGVSFDISRNKWRSEIMIEGVKFQKRFKTLDEAVRYREDLYIKSFK